MGPSDAELLAARLARVKILIESLETACSQSAEQRNIFIRLKQEIDAVRTSLKPIDS
jgi:hypothetical protein